MHLKMMAWYSSCADGDSYDDDEFDLDDNAPHGQVREWIHILHMADERD